MIDILIMGSSRPQLIPYMWQSFKRMCIIRQPYRVWFHEDFVYPSTSHAACKMVEDISLRENGRIKVVQHNPAIGLGPAMDHMFKNHITADYMFYLQEDWEFERPVDIDQITWMMDQNPDVNLVIFNKYRTSRKILNKFEDKQVNKSGVDLCLFNSWVFLPGIWRMPFVRPRWVTQYDHPESYFTKTFLGRENPEWCEEHMGAYIYGGYGGHSYRYVRHIGNSWRMAEWRMEKGRPGGMIEWDIQDLPNKAPWIPLTPDVPLNKELGIKDESFVKMLKERPIYRESRSALKGYIELSEEEKNVRHPDNKLK